MDKSMYSLILMDDVVRAVDKMAHEKGTSRSNLINRILAQELSVLTPELCISQIFEAATSTLDSQVELQPAPQTGSILTVRGVLPFKYNPTIRYQAEITDANGSSCTGKLKVASRTQSEPLLAKLSVFFELWSQVETNCYAERFPNVQLHHTIEGGKFLRNLQTAAQQDADNVKIGQAVGKYMLMMHDSMTHSFNTKFGVDMQTYDWMVGKYSKYLDELAVAI